MATVAALAARAFDKIDAALTDVVKAATVTHSEQGAYDPGTGEYETITTTTDGRAVFATSQPVEDVFPGYAAGPGELLTHAEGFGFGPAENDGITIDGTDYTVTKVGDIAGSSGAWALMVVAS